MLGVFGRHVAAGATGFLAKLFGCSELDGGPLLSADFLDDLLLEKNLLLHMRHVHLVDRFDGIASLTQDAEIGDALLDNELLTRVAQTLIESGSFLVKGHSGFCHVCLAEIDDAVQTSAVPSWMIHAMMTAGSPQADSAPTTISRAT